MGDINIEYAKYITFKDSGPSKTCHTVLACFAVGKQLLPLLMLRRKMGQKVMICQEFSFIFMLKSGWLKEE